MGKSGDGTRKPQHESRPASALALRVPTALAKGNPELLPFVPAVVIVSVDLSADLAAW
jgi:hypothetical protein